MKYAIIVLLGLYVNAAMAGFFDDVVKVVTPPFVPHLIPSGGGGLPGPLPVPAPQIVNLVGEFASVVVKHPENIIPHSADDMVVPTPIRMMAGSPLTGEDVKETRLRWSDGALDVVTFGDHGRHRDTERAHEKEELAQAIADGATKTRAEKKNGLERMLKIEKDNEEDWQTFAKIAPQAITMEEKILKALQFEIANRAKLKANLNAAKTVNADTSMALRMITEAFLPQPMTADDSETRKNFVNNWDSAIKMITNVAANTKVSEANFINRAIANADDVSLQDALVQIGNSYSQLTAMNALAQQNIAATKGKEADLEKELAELK